MRAFCPGHITGFFTVDDSHPDILRRGSRGAGFCVEAGATADIVYEDDSEPAIIITINGDNSRAPVTRRGIEHILQNRSGVVTADIQLDAPLNQGFGMSSAGTFAACLALAELLDINDVSEQALKATHRAEVELGTGLGDAVAQSVGGGVIREAPGIGPSGRVRGFQLPISEVCVCILGDGLSTDKIITSDERKKLITSAGNKCLEEFAHDAGFDNFIALSNRFAGETGLLTGRMSEVLHTMPGRGSMVMLGNAVFAFGDADVLEKEMDRFGKVIRTSVSHSGASLVR